MIDLNVHGSYYINIYTYTKGPPYRVLVLAEPSGFINDQKDLRTTYFARYNVQNNVIISQ